MGRLALAMAAALCAACGDNHATSADAGIDASDGGTCTPGVAPAPPASTVACAELGFPGLPSLATPGVVTAVTAADFDHDTNVDLAVAITSGSRRFIRVLASDGAGRFTTVGETDVVIATALLAADLDGDTHLDLVAGVQQLSGNGDGTFAPAIPFDTDAAGTPSLIADFDHDAKQDLILASPPRFRRGNGDGTFAAPVAIPDPGAAATASALLDADADLDLVFANGATALGNGDGTFAAPTAHTFGSAVGRLFAIDLDGDAKVDLVGTRASDGRVSTFRGNGDGTFAARVDSALFMPGALFVADADADGDRDLLAIADGYVRTAPNPGTGAFTTTTSSLAAPFGPSVIAADLNGDGRTDLVGGNASSAGLHLVFAAAAGFVVRREDTDPPLTNDTGTVVADVTGDGIVDVLRAEIDDRVGVGVYYGLGNAGVHSRTDYAIAEAPRVAFGVGDTNADAITDLVALYSIGTGSRVVTLPGTADGAFAAPIIVGTVADGAGRGSIAMADVNGDARPDIIAGTGNGPSSPFFAVLLNLGSGMFAAPVTYPPPPNMGSYPTQLRVVDFDLDCHLDVLLLDLARAAVIVYRGAGDGTFGTAQVIPYAPDPQGDLALAAFDVGDLDADGDLDLVVATGTSSMTGIGGSVTVLRNDAGTFTRQDIANAGQPHGVAIADLDADGHADLVSADANAQMVEVFAGRGDGTFAPGRRFSTGGIADVIVADLDRDGRLDLITGGEHVGVLYGRCL